MLEAGGAPQQKRDALGRFHAENNIPVKLLLLSGIILASRVASASALQEPLGRIRLSIDEPVIEQRTPRVAVMLATVAEYPCVNLTVASQQRQVADTIAITLLGLTPEELCQTAVGPATARNPIVVSPGRYVLAITSGGSTDRLDLIVSSSHLALRLRGTLRFIEPDTSTFLRPSAHSFLVSCGTPDVPELCDDLGDWIGRQSGIVHMALREEERIGFPRYGGYWQNDYRLFEYKTDDALQSVRRCIRFLADTLAQAVGVGAVLQTADGEVLRAWPHRAFHEQHIAVPKKVSGSRGCPTP